MAKKKPARTVSAAHKAALAEGRDHSRRVRAYLEALESHRPRRGRRRTPESIEKRLASIDEQLPEASALDRVQLIQERLDLDAELATLTGDSGVGLDALEDDFVAVAATYSDRKGISYAAWREVGVPAATLKRAGIAR